MGTCRKLNYLDSHGVSLKNIIILIDIPSSFVKEQESYKAITIQHYDITGKSKLFYHYNMFLAYLKPSEIFKSIKDKILCNRKSVKFDTISNDWNNGNRESYLTPPPCRCRARTGHSPPRPPPRSRPSCRPERASCPRGSASGRRPSCRRCCPSQTKYDRHRKGS